jgi:antitoxin component YwqK of YwqJK toxin-antitoxin module
MKRITDADFKYEFYTTDKSPGIKDGRQYYWFKGGAIHNSQSGVAGELLHDRFTKFYRGNQMAEQGSFNNGLKNGIWKSWHRNGMLQSEEYWKQGLKAGLSNVYDVEGKLLEKGRYKNSKKHGRWINYTSKDTVNYHRGEIVVEKPRLTKEEKASQKAAKKLRKGETVKKPNLLQRLFQKKRKGTETEAEKSEKEPGEKVSKQNQKKDAGAHTAKKQGFFRRLFGKKQPN